MSLSAEIAIRDRIAVISLSGRIIADETNELVDQLAGIIGKGSPYLVFDLEKLTYCNSSGLNFFIRCLTKTRNAGGDVILVGMHPSVKKLFELSKLDQIFTMDASVEDAAERLSIA